MKEKKTEAISLCENDIDYIVKQCVEQLRSVEYRIYGVMNEMTVAGCKMKDLQEEQRRLNSILSQLDHNDESDE